MAPKRPPHDEAERHKGKLRLPLLRVVVFEAIDKDKDKGCFIDGNEMAEFGQYIGNRNLTPSEIGEMFQKTDTNNDGKCSLEEFQNFAH